MIIIQIAEPNQQWQNQSSFLIQPFNPYGIHDPKSPRIADICLETYPFSCYNHQVENNLIRSGSGLGTKCRDSSLFNWLADSSWINMSNFYVNSVVKMAAT